MIKIKYFSYDHAYQRLFFFNYVSVESVDDLQGIID